MANWQDKIRKTVPFTKMKPDAVQTVIDRARIRQVPDGKYLVHEGERWPHLFMIETGETEAIKVSREGRRLVALTFNPGDVFWGLTFFDEDFEMPISLRAKGAVSIVIWSQDDLMPLSLEDGKSLWSLNGLLVHRMLQASAIVEDLAFQPVAGRLAKLLLTQYGKMGTSTIERDLTLDDMAARVGTTREMVCRLLHKFADLEMINITRTEFSLVDKEQLSKIAGGE